MGMPLPLHLNLGMWRRGILWGVDVGLAEVSNLLGRFRVLVLHRCRVLWLMGIRLVLVWCIVRLWRWLM